MNVFCVVDISSLIAMSSVNISPANFKAICSRMSHVLYIYIFLGFEKPQLKICIKEARLVCK